MFEIYQNGAKVNLMTRITIWILMLLGGGALGVWLDLHWCKSWFLNPWFHAVSFLIGIFVIRLVMRASRNTGRWLAKMGREGDIPRMETNKLVTGGFYACMRHPMHFGLLLFPPAFAFLIGSVSFILFIAPIEMAIIIAMIKIVEEPGAIRKFGQDYRNYKNQVPMFSLRWVCLKELFGKK
ncbi:MAG TPA: isoprenylcysteine carboxylmethyltransferase family protein [Bacteroidetes bacterium]|nr:isoprenylcysteine carboxylmethyltransferase family protein [Bacteroidota bacterium]